MDEMNPNNNLPDEAEEPKSEINDDVVLTPSMSPFRAGLLGLFGALVFYQVFGGILTLLIFGSDIGNADVNSMRMLTMAGQILFILLPALVFSKLIYEDVTNVVRFRLPVLKEVGLFILAVIILNPLLQSFVLIQNFYIELWTKDIYFFQKLKGIFEQLNELIEKSYGTLLRADSIAEGLLVVLVVAVTPAVCEELMFRGYIQRSFELKFKKFGGAVITAIFFAIFHFNPFALIPLFALGLFFGFACYKTNSIFVPIGLHFLNNFSAVILFFIFGEDELKQNKVIAGSDIGNIWLSFGYQAVLFVIILVAIHLYYKRKESLILKEAVQEIQ